MAIQLNFSGVSCQPELKTCTVRWAASTEATAYTVEARIPVKIPITAARSKEIELNDLLRNSIALIYI